MENLQDLNEIKQELSEYNKEPVVYCKHCLSLNIRILDGNNDFCDTCGSTETDSTDIFTWMNLYKNKYNKDF